MNTLDTVHIDKIFNPQASNPDWFGSEPHFPGATLEKKGAGSYEDPALVDGCDRLLNRRGLNGRSGQTLPGQATSPAVFRDVTHRGVEGTVFPFLNVAFDRVHHQLRQFQTGVIRLMALRQVIRGLAAHDH